MSGSTAALWRSPRVAPLLVFAFALLLFSINLDRPPHPDELHHVLAGKGLLDTGRPALAEGEYWRGLPHTGMVAASYAVFGEGLSSARLPAVIIVALVALIMFVWIRREVGSLAAWLTAALFISSPFTVEIAQFSRFYALQMLSFVLASIFLYVATTRDHVRLKRIQLLVGAILLFALALWLQLTTVIGLAGIALWGVGFAALAFFGNPATSPQAQKAAIVGLVLLGVTVVVLAYASGLLELAWDRFRATSITNAATRDEFWFYHVRFLLFYPTLWPLVGVFAVLFIARNPKLGWFCVGIFAISFLLASFAGPKNTRYLSFAPPFLVMIWGIGLAYAFPALERYTMAARSRLIDTLGLPPRFRPGTASFAVALALSIVVIMNPFWIRTATIIGDVSLPGEKPLADWPAARDALAPWTEDAGIMITTEELGAIYFLGRSDVRFSSSKFAELLEDQRFEFGLDYRTGRPVISTPESVAQLIECFAKGFVVGPEKHWGDPILISDEIQAIIRRHAEPIEVPDRSHLYAWGWQRESQTAEPAYCSRLQHFSGRQRD